MRLYFEFMLAAAAFYASDQAYSTETMSTPSATHGTFTEVFNLTQWKLA